MQQVRIDEFLAKAGLKRLNKTWAKLEILLGLMGIAVGILSSQWALLKVNEPDWTWIAGGVSLFVFGGYLTLADHRSHLYQSNNLLTALLLQELKKENA